jgi:putative transport protein
MAAIVDLLAENPLLLLFITAAIGYAVGRIKIKGASLGVAAVLFVGLFIGSFSPDLTLPEFAFTFGLAVFVYTIGLSTGAGFFASFRRGGLRDNLFTLVMLLFAAGLTAAIDVAFALKATVTAGIFAGSLTNTPALAGVLEAIRSSAPQAALEQMLAEPVVGYSVTYPVGVLGPIFAILLMSRLWKIDYRREANKLRSLRLVEQEIYNVTAEVTQPDATAAPLRELVQRNRWEAVFGRISRGGEIQLADGDTVLQRGDLVSVIGPPEQVDAIVAALGAPSTQQLELDRSRYDFRRIFVSNSALVGRRLGDLNLPQQYDAIVTRIRRGDVDFVAGGDTVLELGDRVRVVANRERMKEVSDLFGDSYKHLSEVDLLSFGLGMSLGLLLGMIPIPLPGGVTFTLGSAGGPLVVALILGALRRTGPVVWTIPYSANLTLRQIGLIMLLASVGLRSGYTFVSTFAEGGGLTIFLAGAIISLTTAFAALFVGYKLLKRPFGMLAGMVASLFTQPAVLGFSLEQARDESPNVGYALVYPVSMIGKIILAQLLLRLLS